MRDTPQYDIVGTEVDIGRATSTKNNLTVHASAGTGKTWLLASRIIRLLLAGVAPGAILAITFTRKAAAEIHQRVSERLLVMASCGDEMLKSHLTQLGAEPNAETVRQARGLYEQLLSAEHELRASTFHAFCQEILHRFPLEAAVPPGFDLVETTGDLLAGAWQGLQRELSDAEPGELATAMDALLQGCGGLFNTRQALHEFFNHRSDWWAYTEDASDAVTEAGERLQQTLQVRAGEDPVRQLLDDEALRTQLQRYAALLAKHPIKTHLERVQAISQACDPSTGIDQAFASLLTVFFKRDATARPLAPNKTLTARLGSDGTAELVLLHEALQTRLETTREQRLRHRTLELSRAWYVCGTRLLQHYQRLKSEQNLLDFADLEWQTYRLLARSRHAEWVQYKLDQRIDHLLVDEFQDTNPTQWRLLLPLLQEMAAGGNERGRSVFLVGDDKQSIYRFRRADPRLFHAARDWLAQHMEAVTYAQHMSWRSSPAIIQFVNLMFDDAGHDVAALNDGDGSGSRLPGFPPHDTHQRDLPGSVELLPLVRRPVNEPPTAATPLALRDPLEQPRIIAEDQRYRLEAERVAACVKSIIGRPVTVDQTVRPLHYGDIVVLLRDRTHATYYEAAFREAGIPYSGAARGTFLECLEVRDLLCLLQSLIAPYDDLALATVLRCPLFACGDDDLIRVAQAGRDSPWINRLSALAAESETQAPLARAARWLHRWRGHVDRIPVHDLLDRIYYDGNVVARFISAAPPHLKPRVESNLARFLELALEADSGRYPSLSRFLQWLKSLDRDDRDALSEPPTRDRQRLKIMTIHAAKGLEAPAVFLVDAARDRGQPDKGPRALIDWPVDHARPQHLHLIGNKKDQDDKSRRILEHQQAAARREQTNLLYVALTRAKQYLFISGCEPARGDSRGWYGYIERRLRRLSKTGAALPPGLTIEHIRDEDGHIINTLGRTGYGDNRQQPDTEPTPLTDAPAAIDPALTRPLARPAHSGFVHPSLEDGQTQAATDVPPAHPDATAAKQRGIAIHRLLERLAGDPDPAALRHRLRNELGASLSDKQFNDWWREASDVTQNPAFAPWFDASHYLQARNELPLLYEHDGRSVYGIIDRVVINAHEITLIDYKTHTQATPQNIKPLAEGYREQMRLYREGVKQLWPHHQVRAVLIFTACNGIVEIN